MRNRKIILLIVLIVVACSILFTACGPKSATIIPNNREVEKIEILYQSSYDDEVKRFTLNGEQKSQLVVILNDQGSIKRTYVNLQKESEYYKYTINITLKKKFLKKQMTYSLKVLHCYKIENIFTKDKMWTSSDTLFLTYKDNTFKGTATNNLLNFLKNLCEPESLDGDLNQE